MAGKPTQKLAGKFHKTTKPRSKSASGGQVVGVNTNWLLHYIIGGNRQKSSFDQK
jgi:hypothetical protein